MNTVHNFVTPTDLYVAVVESLGAADGRKLAEDGSYRGSRHGVFTASVDQAADVLLNDLGAGTYSVREVGQVANVQGWAVRVAAKKLIESGELDATLHSGGRGNPSQIEIHSA